MLDGVTNREEDAQREVQRQRNLEQALLIQMEMQKKLHEQLEVSLSLLLFLGQHLRLLHCNSLQQSVSCNYCIIATCCKPRTCPVACCLRQTCRFC